MFLSWGGPPTRLFWRVFLGHMGWGGSSLAEMQVVVAVHRFISGFYGHMSLWEFHPAPGRSDSFLRHSSRVFHVMRCVMGGRRTFGLSFGFVVGQPLR